MLSWIFIVIAHCCVLRGDATNTNFIVFGLTRSGLEPTIYRTRDEQAYHYTTDAVNTCRHPIKKVISYPCTCFYGDVNNRAIKFKADSSKLLKSLKICICKGTMILTLQLHIYFKLKLKFLLSLNNTICDNYTHKQTGNKENIKSTFSSKYVKSLLSSVLMTFFLKRNPVYLLEMVLMDLVDCLM